MSKRSNNEENGSRKKFQKSEDSAEELPDLYYIFYGTVASLQEYGAFIKIPGLRKQVWSEVNSPQPSVSSVLNFQVSNSGVREKLAMDILEKLHPQIIVFIRVEGTKWSVCSGHHEMVLQDCLSTCLVHKSQMSKARVEDPSEMLSVGEKVYCKVISLENDKISLSMKVVNQTTGQDEDPANVQSSMDQQRKRKVHGERPRIELGAVLDTTCKKCGGHGHLAQDCFHTKGGKVYELIPEPEKTSFFKMDPDTQTTSSSKKKKKKDKKLKKSKKHKKYRQSSSDSSYESGSSDEKRKKKHKKHKKQKHKKKHSRNSSLSDDE